MGTFVPLVPRTPSGTARGPADGAGATVHALHGALPGAVAGEGTEGQDERPAGPFRPGLAAPGRPSTAPREETVRPEPRRSITTAEGFEGLNPARLARLQQDLAARLDAEASEREAARAAEHAALMKRLAAREAEIEAERTVAREQAAKAEAEAKRLAALANELAAIQARVVREVREELGPLVLAAARALAGEALRTDPRLMDELVEDAVMALGRDQLVLRVAPADAARLRERLPDVLVREDPSVEAGCVATGPAGRIDASLGYATEVVAQTIRRWQEGG